MAGKRYKLTFDLYDGTKKSVVFDVPEGEPGYTPVKGLDYHDGTPGKNGVSIVSVRIEEA